MFKPFFHFFRSHKALLAQVFLVVVFIGVLAWGASIPTSPPQDEIEKTPIVPAVTLQVTALTTATPVESTPNQNETEGIIYAGILLVLIIVVGTLGVINQRN